MNIALLIAGGSGSRMHQDIPKQFLTVNEKPVIIYTLEAFQKHPAIDEIVVVCIKGWEQVLWAYVKQFSLTKVISIITGGDCGQNSIYRGLREIAKTHKPDDIVLVHDAIWSRKRSYQIVLIRHWSSGLRLQQFRVQKLCWCLKIKKTRIRYLTGSI